MSSYFHEARVLKLWFTKTQKDFVIFITGIFFRALIGILQGTRYSSSGSCLKYENLLKLFSLV